MIFANIAVELCLDGQVSEYFVMYGVVICYLRCV